MRFIYLDANEMIDRESLHSYIAKQFGIKPYGNSLDMMLMALIDLKYEYLIRIKNSDSIESNLGDYGKAFIDVLGVAREINPMLHIRLLWETTQLTGL